MSTPIAKTIETGLSDAPMLRFQAIFPEDDRAFLLDEQNGNCAICGKTLALHDSVAAPAHGGGDWTLAVLHWECVHPNTKANIMASMGAVA